MADDYQTKLNEIKRRFVDAYKKKEPVVLTHEEIDVLIWYTDIGDDMMLSLVDEDRQSPQHPSGHSL